MHLLDSLIPPRLPRVLLAVLTIVTLTLLLSYSRITSTTHLLLWHETDSQALPLPAADDDKNDDDDDVDDDDYFEAHDNPHIFDGILPMAYGVSSRPPMRGMPDEIVARLPDEFVPSAAGPTRRLVIVGDVHGQRAALDALLEKLGFDAAAGDHLIFAGDMTNKGPDSAGVIDVAMRLGAHAVRGNHDDAVLLTYASLPGGPAGGGGSAGGSGAVDLETKVIEKEKASQQEQDGGGGGGGGGSNGKEDEKETEQAEASAREEFLARESASLLDRPDRPAVRTARSLSPAQAAWLARQPIILEVGRIPRPVSSSASSGDQNQTAPAAFENLVVVHAGLVPNVSLADQDPYAVMKLRTLVYPVQEERTAAVRTHLEDLAARRPGEQKPVSDEQVEKYLARITLASSEQKKHDPNDEVALPTEGREGVPWWQEWNRFQERLAREGEGKRQAEEEGAKKDASASGGADVNPDEDNDDDDDDDDDDDNSNDDSSVVARRRLKGTTVVYGHDAKSGLKVPDTYGNESDSGTGSGRGYTYGLDSGCVYGGNLSAMVIEACPDGGIVHTITQVGCDKAVEPTS